MVENSLKVTRIKLVGARIGRDGLFAPRLAARIVDVDCRRVGRVRIEDIDGIIELSKVACCVRAVEWPRRLLC